jgi:hypothetical protein
LPGAVAGASAKAAKLIPARVETSREIQRVRDIRRLWNWLGRRHFFVNGGLAEGVLGMVVFVPRNAALESLACPLFVV